MTVIQLIRLVRLKRQQQQLATQKKATATVKKQPKVKQIKPTKK